ncbi:MAB_1171c family putative transporter [Streptomyces sp. NBC_00316]|uniref:MAB_1171c family putative transporter n=1 Tax=Streptomyces sp. NBC_00316 TaxID=2975710 RepID=UPI002E29BE76|nr:MAB_1171c family putative transporter [Streptomyces sp. NBC_00316]
MIDAIPAALLWAVTLWRARSAFRRPGRLSLWLAFAALALAMTVRPVAIALTVDEYLHVTNLSFLVKHICGTVAAAAVLTFVADMAESKTGVRASRLHMAVPVVTIVLLAACFFATPQPHQAKDLLTDYADHATILAYGVVWTSYLGAALLSATLLCFRWGRRPDSGLVGRGLVLIGTGTAVGLVYAVHRIAALGANFNDRALIGKDTDHALSTGLLFIALLLIVLGSTLPAFPRIGARIRAHWQLVNLYPLWRTLTDAVPETRLDTPSTHVADAADPRRTHDRLYRRTIEIRDAILTLADHAPAELRGRAYDHATSLGFIGAHADITAEACWLAVAREQRLRGTATGSGEPMPPASGGRDLATEIRALTTLSTAYNSRATQDFFRAHLEEIPA